MAAGTFEELASKIGNALLPLEAALDPANAVAFFEQLGARFPIGVATDSNVNPALVAASTAAGALRPLLSTFVDADASGDTAAVIGAGLALIGQFATLADALGDLSTAINATPAAWSPLTAGEVHAFTADLVARILEGAMIEELERQRPEFAAAGTLLGIIDRFDLPIAGAEAEATPATSRRFQLGNLTSALESPADYLTGVFNWGSSPFDPLKLFERLQAVRNLFSYGTSIDTSGATPVLNSLAVSVLPNVAVTPPGLDVELNFPVPDGFAFSADLGAGFSSSAAVSGALADGAVLTIVPPSSLQTTSATPFTFQGSLVRAPIAPATAIVLFGETGATRLEAQAITFTIGARLSPGGPGAVGDIFAKLAITGGKAVLDLSDGDGLVGLLVPGGHAEASFEVSANYSVAGGLTFEAGANLKIDLPLHVSFAGVNLDGLTLGFPIGAPGRIGLPIDLATSLRAALGPFVLVVDGVGLGLDLTLGSGRLLVADVTPHFLPPTGIGVSIDGGGISGGGFLTHDPSTGRYAGALELRVFVVSVKAFGILDTRFPDGTEGVSFVVVIIAEFTPVQLGFGFTLVGVGGLLAINRTVDERALGDAVRTGSLENLLFPRNPVQDAPTIINDLATVFPAARDHQLFGPMAKLGWGTPTLVSADLGIIIEFPGPRIALLGVLRMQLPKPDFALVSLQMAILGLFDFPAGKMEIDASLYDSYVVGFGVSGDMAYRLQTGNSSAFLLSVGGYNTAFQAPTQFPKLRRAAVDLGVNGNPSLTASGYFAITSNTVQFGGAIDLRAHGFGIHLSGHLGVDVLFQFSPLHFTASFDASVHVDFHGFGLGVSLHGSISGPSPWHVDAKACVSIAFWDACLPVRITFGNDTPASLPELDPWDGTPVEQRVDPRIDVIGLAEAVADPRNWAGEAPPEGFAAVSLAPAATADRTPIDPMGAVSLHQKVCPLKQVLERFGEYAPTGHTRFEITSVVFNLTVTLVNTDADHQYVDRSEKFAPAHFMKLSDAKRLSMPSYDDMVAGVSIAPNRVAAGPSGSATLDYETVFINAQGERVQEPAVNRFTLTDVALQALLVGSATGRAGLRRAGARKYVVPGRAPLLTLAPATFVVANACSLATASDVTPKPVSRTQALLALHARASADPVAASALTIVPMVTAA